MYFLHGAKQLTLRLEKSRAFFSTPQLAEKHVPQLAMPHVMARDGGSTPVPQGMLQHHRCRWGISHASPPWLSAPKSLV